MPYDSTKTRNLLTISGAFAGQPGGEYIQEIAAQLREAEAEIVVAHDARKKAESEANRFSAELENAQTAVRRLREGNAGYNDMLTALQMIAKSSRGAQKLAADTLATVNGGKAVEAKV